MHVHSVCIRMYFVLCTGMSIRTSTPPPPLPLFSSSLVGGLAEEKKENLQTL